MKCVLCGLQMKESRRTFACKEQIDGGGHFVFIKGTGSWVIEDHEFYVHIEKTCMSVKDKQLNRWHILHLQMETSNLPMNINIFTYVKNLILIG